MREGPLTATEAAELLSDSPGNMSSHLQTLPRGTGYVEEAEGGVGQNTGGGIASPLARRTTARRRVIPSCRWRPLPSACSGMERALERFRVWLGERNGYSRQWQHAWFSANNLSYLLPEELEKLGEDIVALLIPDRDRLRAP